MGRSARRRTVTFCDLAPCAPLEPRPPCRAPTALWTSKGAATFRLTRAEQLVVRGQPGELVARPPSARSNRRYSGNGDLAACEGGGQVCRSAMSGQQPTRTPSNTQAAHKPIKPNFTYKPRGMQPVLPSGFMRAWERMDMRVCLLKSQRGEARDLARRQKTPALQAYAITNPPRCKLWSLRDVRKC